MAIFGIGTVVVDHVVELPGYPLEDTKVETVSDWRQVGGPVPVALSTAAHFGIATTFLGRWGNDEHGQMIESVLRHRGISLHGLTRDDSDAWSSGFAHVWVAPNGCRTIAYSRGTFPIPEATDVDERVVEQHSVLHLDGWAGSAAIRAAGIVKASGGTVLLDAGSVKPHLSELLPLVDVLVASKLFRESQFERPDVDDDELLRLGPPVVISTNGRHGATWISREGKIHSPAIDVQAVDTNGAGDVFAGAVSTGLERKLAPDEILSFANRVAGHSCRYRGNSSWPDV